MLNLGGYHVLVKAFDSRGWSMSLAEVRHDRSRTLVNSFKISSSSREVYTTFTIEFEPLGEAQIELLQK